MKGTRKIFWLILFVLTIFAGCGPEQEPTPSLATSYPVATKIDFNGALERLENLEKSLSLKSGPENIALINNLTESFAISFPLEVDKPFSLHSLHDLIMKNTRAINKATLHADLKPAWEKLLNTVEQKNITHGSLRFPIDTKVARLVLSGGEPTLVTKLRNDFTTFTNAELKERNSISEESFWQNAFLYDSSSGVSKEQDTGAVLIFNEGTIIAVLEFKNQLATVKPIDLNSQKDLINIVPKTPGYVSSVGRRAAYARFGIGEKLFNQFFAYARANGIGESYLHVREDNISAINLYKSLGYLKVAEVPGYYQGTVNAHVMKKTF